MNGTQTFRKGCPKFPQIFSGKDLFPLNFHSKFSKFPLNGKHPLFSTPAKVAEAASETKESYCCCSNNVVDNHRVYYYGEKAKSDGILMALEELTEVDFTPTNVQGICTVRV